MKTLIFLFLFIFLPAANAASTDLTIGPPETISETRITRTIFEYVMRAKITNPGPAAAAISATVTSSSANTVIVQNTLTFGNVGALTTADSTGTFTLRHDRIVPFDPTKLTWTIKQPFIVSAATPTAGASEVGVTFRPQVFFSKPVDPATLNANNFFAKGPDGQKLPATILPANDATFAWLFFTAPMPAASQVQVTVDGATIRLAGGADLLDAANTGTPGSKLTFDFSTVSLAPLANTTVWGRIVDPGPDLLPHTADDSLPGPDGQYMTEDDIHLLPIAGVHVFLIGLENRAVFTDAAGRFQIDGVPSGNVKVVIDGRTATTPPGGYYFPEMVMDATMQPGLNNFVMKGMESMYLPRIPTTILQAVSASQTVTVTLKPEAALDLPPAQQPFLTVEIQPGSLVNNGQHVATGQVGISVVPPELVRDMLPPGLLQHTFDITVQAPGITNFSTPAPMTFPNVFNEPPGTKLNFLSFDHTTGRLVIEGTATVSIDGLSVITDPGTGITHPGWHGLTPPGVPTKIRLDSQLCPENNPGTPPFPNPESGDIAYDSRVGAYSTPCADCAIHATPRGAGANEAAILAAVSDSESGIAIIGAAGGSRIGASILTGFINPQSDHVAIAYRVPGSGRVEIAELLNGSDIWGSGSPGSRSLEDFSGQQNCVIGVPVVGLTPTEADALRSAMLAATQPGRWYSFNPRSFNPNDSNDKGDTCATTVGDQIRESGIDPNFATPGPIGQRFNNLTPSQVIEWAKDRYRRLHTSSGAGAAIAEDKIESPVNAAAVQAMSAIPGPILSNAFYRVFFLANGDLQELSGYTDSLGQFSVFLPPDSPAYIMAFHASTNTLTGNFVKTGNSGSSLDTSLIARVGANLRDFDTDADGIPDISERVVGTSPTKYSTVDDGISDGAKVAQGLNPLSGVAFPTGIIANLPIPGEAKEVVLEGSTTNSRQQTAYVAAGSGGLAIVNASQFQQPLLLSRLALPGDATDVSVDSNLQIAVVAANSGGLHFVNVSDPLNPALLRTISVTVNQVEVVDGIAYAATGSQIYSYDLLTGERLQVLSPGSANITGLAREGSILYSMDASFVLRAIDIGGANMIAWGSLTMPAGGGKLFVGGGIASVAAEIFLGGFATANVSNPNALTLLSGVDADNVAGKTVVANGSGLAIAVGSPSNLGNLLEVLNFSDPANTGAFITQFTLPADPESVAIGSGIAFVADGSAGLQVVNYRSFDNQGVAPTVAVNTTGMDVDSTKPGLQVLEGSLVSVPVQTSDDVQVRNVELLLNSQVVQNDVTFPFDLKAAMPTLAPGATTVTVQVRATDTGGNIGLSSLVTLELLPDTTPPTLVSVNPINNSGHSLAFRTVTLRFSEPLDIFTATATNIQLLGLGGAIVPQTIQFRNNDTTAQLTYPTLAVGSYQIVLLATAIHDRAGNALGTTNVVSSFNIRAATAAWATNADGDWDNAANWEGGNVPNPTDDVLIEVPGDATITYHTGDTAIHSLISKNRFVLLGGTLNVATTLEVDNTFWINGGTLVNATVASGAGGMILSAGNATLDGVTLATDLTMQAAAVLNVKNGLTVNNAKVTLLGDESGTYIYFQGTQTLGGNGEVVFRLAAGKVTTAIGSSDDPGRSVAAQSDGKIVVAGWSSNGSNDDFALVRYNADGSLDTSFNATGKVTSDLGGNDIGYSVAYQSDGKIVVAGHAYNGSNYDFALVRYNANGSVDPSFGNGGKVTTAIGTDDDSGRSVAMQDDGKIVVAGWSFNGGNNDFALVRYNADGTLDSGFGNGGKVTTAIGSVLDEGESVAVQSDGKIVVAGYSRNGSTYDFAVVRYHANGTLDASFNGSGKVTTAVGGGDDIGISMVVQSDQRIIVAGWYYIGSQNNFAMVRYNANGTLDSGFGNGGKVTTAIGSGNDQGYSVALQSDGKIVVAGSSNNGSDEDFALVRYNADGTLDTSFNGAGKVRTDIGGGNNSAQSVVVQGDGKIVVAGNSFNGSNYDFALARYNANGTLDMNFNNDSNGNPVVANNYLYARGDNTQAGAAVLTIGPNITIHGSQGGTVAGYYSQDSVINQGTILADTVGKTITINGNFTNQGTVQASGGGTLATSNAWTNSGLVRAGVGGTISMSGGFTNFAGGSVAIEIGGTAAGQFGRITINGSAALAGTLNLSAVNGFDPALNSSFNVLTYTSHTGQFDTVNGSIGNGKQFAVTYGASGLTVNTVAASPLPTPAPPPITPSIKKVDDNFHIEFQSIAGRSYRIEWTDDLVAGKWTALTDEAIAGTGKLIKVIDAGAGTQKQGFYRVVETQTAATKKP